MTDKVQTAFKLHLKTVNDLDALADAPPAWLNDCAPGPVRNRTDVVERLVFLAIKHRWFGDTSHGSGENTATVPSAKREPSKAKQSAKR